MLIDFVMNCHKKNSNLNLTSILIEKMLTLLLRLFLHFSDKPTNTIKKVND